MTMAYVLAVQPSAICGFGPDPYITDINGVVISKSALLVMCALVSGIITLFMGLYANLPLALSTAMGSNFILGGLVNSGTVSFGWAMALLLCSGILFILVTVLGVRKMVVDLLPKNLKIAIPTAVGFFIAYLGFKNTGLAAFSDSGLALGDFTQPAVLLALITMAVMGVLTAYKVRGAILIGIIVGTVISIPMGVSTLPTTLVSLPDMSEIGNLVLCYDFKSVLADIPGALVWIFILFTSDFFATFGALIAVGAQTNMLDEDGNFPQIEKPFLVDAVGTVVGSGTGCTTISTFIESTIGVEAGGRTGLTAIVSGGLFLHLPVPAVSDDPHCRDRRGADLRGLLHAVGLYEAGLLRLQELLRSLRDDPVRHLHRRHRRGNLPGRADGRADQGADGRCKEGPPGAVCAVHPAGAVLHRVNNRITRLPAYRDE
jgi:AGZA family xanthine/uracil permease-like MFS transporter